MPEDDENARELLNPLQEKSNAERRFHCPLDKSTLELGMEALSRMPRAQAIEGAMAFQGLR